MNPGLFWLTADGRSLTALPGFICSAALNNERKKKLKVFLLKMGHDFR
jgi:hypothetical protein